MDNEKLSAREKALIADARREAVARANVPGGAQAKPAPTAAERLARLMEEERAETLRRKKKMRRYGIGISAAILALFALWALRASRRR